MKKFRVPVLILAAVCLLQTFASFGAGVKSVNPFVLQDKSIQIYRDRTSQLTYSLIDREPIADALAALPRLSVAKTPSKKKRTAAFLSVDAQNNYQKRQYDLRPNELRYDGTSYTLTAKQYDSLKKAFDQAVKKESPYPQWLIWMNPNRITSIRFTDRYGDTYSVNSANRLSAAKAHRSIAISSSKGEKYDPKKFNTKRLQGSLKTVMTSNSGVTCTVVMDGNSLYVEASDMTFGCRYDIKTSAFDCYEEDMLLLCETPLSLEDLPELGKPVIYLYPEKTTDVSVKLDFKGDIRYTYPAYNGGWNVTASPDGKLVNKSDGSEHWYLFWDGDPALKYWNFESGFCVKNSDTEAFLKDKLAKLGLTPKEYNDFITYWMPILSVNKYNLITFAASEYENIAALGITPRPDTILRVNMVYKAVNAPLDIPEQKLPQVPERKGFTVVEWGATRAD